MSNVPPPPMPPPPPPGGAPPPPPSYGAMPGYSQHAATSIYAGWWRRVGASLVDGLIGGLFGIPALVALIAGPRELSTCTSFDGDTTLCEVPTGGTIGLVVLLYFAALIVYLVIYCRMLGRGATWGRKALGYRVLDERTMQPIGTGRAVGRYFATILSAMPCYLGFLWPLWDAESRTFHDMIVRTRAVRS